MLMIFILICFNKKKFKVKESNLLDIAGKEVTQLASKVSYFYNLFHLLLLFSYDSQAVLSKTVIHKD